MHWLGRASAKSVPRRLGAPPVIPQQDFVPRPTTHELPPVKLCGTSPALLGVGDRCERSNSELSSTLSALSVEALSYLPHRMQDPLNVDAEAPGTLNVSQ